MSWGIAETALEIEKIKAESADYLGGLNSCGEIEWGIYSQAFDFYADLIQKAYELGKTEAEPHWIPVTKPPTDRGICYVTLKDTRDKNRQNWVAEMIYTPWDGFDLMDGLEVLAWMPKRHPEPYKGVTE